MGNKPIMVYLTEEMYEMIEAEKAEMGEASKAPVIRKILRDFFIKKSNSKVRILYKRKPKGD